MTLFGYARVSTSEQDLDIQIATLKAAGCQTIRSERKSGTERGSRTELQILLDFLRMGDTLVVTRIDRLARSMKDLQDIVHELKGRGVALKATEQPIDTGTAAGKAFLDMLGVFAEFETNLRRERQMEGIAAAKVRGVYKGGKARIDPEAVRALAANGMRPSHIARQLGISRGTVYRFLPDSILTTAGATAAGETPAGSVDVAERAEAFAVAAHGDQLYGNEPYRTHLAAVVQILRDFGYTGSYQAAGWLHDVVEDTAIDLETIADHFGPEIAGMVDAVTGLGATRADRNERIYAGIRREPRAAIVKLADRIANVEAARVGSGQADRYVREAAAFAAVVTQHVPDGMWSRLAKALARHEAAAG